jgi:hypothetical protein
MRSESAARILASWSPDFLDAQRCDYLQSNRSDVESAARPNVLPESYAMISRHIDFEGEFPRLTRISRSGMCEVSLPFVNLRTKCMIWIDSIYNRDE